MKVFLFAVLLLYSVEADQSVLPYNGCKTSSETRSLNDFFFGLAEMTPSQDIMNVVLDAVNENEEVVKAVTYLKSGEFRAIAVKVANMPQFKRFLQFIECLGVDINVYIKAVIQVLKLPIRNPSDVGSEAEHAGGLKSTIDEILQLLPIRDMREYYEEQMLIDDDLQAAMKAIGSPEFVQIGDAVKQMPEYKDLLRRLKHRGFDIDAIIESLDEFFGWNLGNKDPKKSFVEY